MATADMINDIILGDSLVVPGVFQPCERQDGIFELVFKRCINRPRTRIECGVGRGDTCGWPHEHCCFHHIGVSLPKHLHDCRSTDGRMSTHPSAQARGRGRGNRGLPLHSRGRGFGLQGENTGQRGGDNRGGLGRGRGGQGDVTVFV